MTGVLFWVRSRADHTPAHLVKRWNGRQVVTMCGCVPLPGGRVIARTELIKIHAFLCCGCAARVTAIPVEV